MRLRTVLAIAVAGAGDSRRRYGGTWVVPAVTAVCSARRAVVTTVAGDDSRTVLYKVTRILILSNFGLLMIRVQFAGQIIPTVPGIPSKSKRDISRRLMCRSGRVSHGPRDIIELRPEILLPLLLNTQSHPHEPNALSQHVELNWSVDASWLPGFFATGSAGKVQLSMGTPVRLPAKSNFEESASPGRWMWVALSMDLRMVVEGPVQVQVRGDHLPF
ncbi:hypothetical protein GGX14DRAFT_384033 [Mycena pura]|uniref:Uncharacterized protein n=1 Tax=Mycena pura TaxID=153505 RepID=A0AAD7E5K4_9AGAR|nr:hypothetical protein GGX14DRAFT_384033 [Mycena pura]